MKLKIRERKDKKMQEAKDELKLKNRRTKKRRNLG